MGIIIKFIFWGKIENHYSCKLNRMSLYEFQQSSSRDNSIIPIRVPIRTGVCDLDVELNQPFHAAVKLKGLFDHYYLHDLSLDRRKSDRFLSNEQKIELFLTAFILHLLHQSLQGQHRGSPCNKELCNQIDLPRWERTK